MNKFNNEVKKERNNLIRKVHEARSNRQKWLKPNKYHGILTESDANIALLDDEVISSIEELTISKIKESINGSAYIIIRQRDIESIVRNYYSNKWIEEHGDIKQPNVSIKKLDNFIDTKYEILLDETNKYIPDAEAVMALFTEWGFYSSYDVKYEQYKLIIGLKGYIDELLNYYFFEWKYQWISWMMIWTMGGISLMYLK